MKPVVVEVSETEDIVLLDVRRYVIESFSSRMPSLIAFTLQNQSLIQLARYLKYERCGSTSSLTTYVYCIWRFSRWTGMEPDELIAECKGTDGFPDPKKLVGAAQRLDQYYMELRAGGLAPRSARGRIAAVKTFYIVNGLAIPFTRRMDGRERCRDRAPTPEELSRLLDIADLRGKVIVACLALGAFREGTLAALRYRHVKHDLERSIVPIQVHVEAEITKGKYHDYDTFLGKEAADYLKEYLEVRRRGSPDGKIPPEEINDESPLIRDKRSKEPKPTTPKQIYSQVHNLYYRAGC